MALLLWSGAAGQGRALPPGKPLKQYGRQSWQSDTGLPQSTVHAIAQAGQGYLWLATEGGLVRFDGQEFRTYDSSNTPAFPGDSVENLAVDGKGVLWISFADGVVRLEGGVFSRVSRGAPSGSGAKVLREVRGNGETWIGTDKGLFRSRAGRQELVAGKGIATGKVDQLFRDREGSIWVIFDGGVSRIGADGLLEEPFDLPGVLSVFEDSEGDMWFGTEASGVTVLREQPFSTLTVQDGLSDDFVRAVFQDPSGRTWVGTNRGGLNEVSGGKITAIRAGKAGGLASNVVLALAESGGDLWIGTPDGLNRVHGGRFDLFTTANGLPDDFVRSLYTDADGSLWIGTRGGLSHYARGRFTSYSTLDGLGSNLIGSILRARDGTLWVGTLGGVSRFDGTGFRNFMRKDGLGGDAITTLAESSDGAIWIAAHGAGLTRLRGGTFTVVSGARVGLPGEIYSVLEDGGGDLWLGTAKGIYKVPLAGLNALVDGRAAAVNVEAFGVADGMKISECSSGGRPAGWKMQDGSLWFATLKGVAIVHPGKSLDERRWPTASIEQVAIDDKVVMDGEGGQVVVPAGRERITIRYAAPSFRAPQKVIFRYKLQGFDREWVMAGSRRTAYYTNIPAGTYTFLVAASYGDGAGSEFASEIKIVVKPRFYRTWWFYLLVTVLVACAVYGVYWLRVRSVEASYRAVMGERNRIAREIHDTLAQGYVGVSLQLEMVGRMLKATRTSPDKASPIEGLVESTKEMVRSSLEEARSSIWNLRSAQSDAEAETLPARLAAAVRMKQEGSTAAIRLTVTGTFRPLNRRVEDELLRMAQESVSNAIRHAAAGAIEVVLKYDTAWLQLKISDDGRGFSTDEPAAQGHYGLQGMRERAAAIGAKLKIESSPGKGTSVEAALSISGASTKRTVEQG